MIMNALLHMWHTSPTHLDSSTRESGRGSAPSLMASNQTRGSRLGTATKGFMSLFETCFFVSTELPTAPGLSSVATPEADNRRTATPPSPFPLAPRRADAGCCVDRASPVLRRNAAAEPAAPLPALDTGAERKESVSPRDSKPTVTASMTVILLDSGLPCPLCCCPCRPMVGKRNESAREGHLKERDRYHMPYTVTVPPSLSSHVIKSSHFLDGERSFTCVDLRGLTHEKDTEGHTSIACARKMPQACLHHRAYKTLTSSDNSSTGLYWPKPNHYCSSSVPYGSAERTYVIVLSTCCGSIESVVLYYRGKVGVCHEAPQTVTTLHR